MRLTTNQLILLLTIHRGTFENELYVGTRTNDVKVLGRLGLIVREVTPTGTHKTTARGNALVATLQTETERFNAGIEGLNRNQIGKLEIQIDSSEARGMVAQAMVGALGNLSHLLHGNFEVEADEGKGLILSDVDGGKARVNGGTIFLVAEAGVTLEMPKEGEEVAFKSVKLESVDMTVHNTEEQATEVATDRAKAQVGSRHLVLKAVAMHEVAVPIKSTRL